MHFLIEAIGVGVYTNLVYTIVSRLPIHDPKVLLICVGFTKHFLGHYLGLHSYYCSNGDACQRQSSMPLAITTLPNLIFESIAEGILFLVVGSALLYSRKHIGLVYFCIGFSLHIAFEVAGFHSLFCNTRCGSK
jgi:hypothetical protein